MEESGPRPEAEGPASTSEHAEKEPDKNVEDKGPEGKEMKNTGQRAIRGGYFGRVTKRGGGHTLEMNEGSTASYLARTPCVPVFMLVLIGLEQKRGF